MPASENPLLVSISSTAELSACALDVIEKPGAPDLTRGAGSLKRHSPLCRRRPAQRQPSGLVRPVCAANWPRRIYEHFPQNWRILFGRQPISAGVRVGPVTRHTPPLRPLFRVPSGCPCASRCNLSASLESERGLRPTARVRRFSSWPRSVALYGGTGLPAAVNALRYPPRAGYRRETLGSVPSHPVESG
jgi:hypothetical protein